MAPPLAAPVVPLLRPRSLQDYNEAFFKEDMSATLGPRGLHKSLACVMGRTAHVHGSVPPSSMDFMNPLADPSLVDITTGVSPSAAAVVMDYAIFNPIDSYVPDGPLEVTLYFGFAGDMNRFGMRSCLFGTNRVLVALPQAEGGVGITPKQIDLLFAKVGLGGKPWVIKTMACFSAGWRGMTGVINNCVDRRLGPNMGPVKKSLGFDLKDLSTLIFFDAFYGSHERHLDNAILGIDQVTGKKAKFVVYEVTNGTPRSANGELAFSFGGLGTNYNDRVSVINLKGSAGTTALIVARAFEAALADKYLEPSQVPKAVLALLPGLPSRGYVVSKSPPASWRAVSKRDTVLSKWEKSENAPWIADVFKDVAKAVKNGDQSLSECLKIITDPNNNWMGWPPPHVAQLQHNGFIQEFGWEFLADG